jgi:uncharacterized membrane protein YgcG
MGGSYFALGFALWVTACSVEQKPAVATAATTLDSEPTTHRGSAAPSKASIAVPALRGRVNDYAGKLTPDQETELSGLYASVEREVGSQIALLTIESSNGVPIEDYSLTVANTWGLGRRGIDDGLLITIAFDDRAIRVEVGSGLELVISDQAAAEVVQRMSAELAARHSFAGIKAASIDLIRMIHDNKALVGTRRP